MSNIYVESQILFPDHRRIFPTEHSEPPSNLRQCRYSGQNRCPSHNALLSQRYCQEGRTMSDLAATAKRLLISIGTHCIPRCLEMHLLFDIIVCEAKLAFEGGGFLIKCNPSRSANIFDKDDCDFNVPACIYCNMERCCWEIFLLIYLC